VTDTDSLERAVQAIANGIPGMLWPLDMVVMNAGVGQLLPALESVNSGLFGVFREVLYSPPVQCRVVRCHVICLAVLGVSLCR
jgi:NAD(P)-dependent dehydrogenase (short-subunit alcohol dehydrogenase family)